MRTGREAGARSCPTRPRASGPAMPKPEDPRMEHVNEIQGRVERSEYEVDASAVAAAIIERLLGGLRLLPKPEQST